MWCQRGHTPSPGTSAHPPSRTRLQSRLKPSPHRTLWIMEPIWGQSEEMWRSDGGQAGGSRPERSSGNQQQSCRNNPRPSFAFHTRDSSGDGSHPLLSAPTHSASDIPLIVHSAIMEKRTFVTRRRISRAFRMWRAHAPFMLEKWRRFRLFFHDFRGNLKCYESAVS